VHIGSWRQHCSAKCRDVGTIRWEVRHEDVIIRTVAELSVVGPSSSDTRIATCDTHAYALQAQLHELIALAEQVVSSGPIAMQKSHLPSLVAHWKAVLIATVADRDDIGGLVHTALKRTFLSCSIRQHRLCIMQKSIESLRSRQGRDLGTVGQADCSQSRRKQSTSSKIHPMNVSVTASIGQ
jgi:hypothetical protein